MKRLIKKIFRFIFKEEIENFKNEQKRIESLRVNYEYQKKHILKIVAQLEKTVGSIDVSVDVHESPYAESWAVISIQGRSDYLKFVNLSNSELRDIQNFLSRFKRSKIDATPQTTRFLRIGKNNY